ncbi:hypothetical protein [Bacillus multifaciens]|uniref:hypothetical protein n=1 Tax=Bacillus multifaciens TaxID=3068506 RepID=UPI002741AED4|nr:hypothetical protein [Bacillus sp. WLY-B-L8]MDP7980468.1 hypothetical protein [Bacillus sp. WLY-B-L8]
MSLTLNKRKTLRENLLKELYDYHLKSGGEALYIYLDVYVSEEDKEKHVAYEYLNDKGLIEYKSFSKDKYMAKITSYGIDTVENS